MSESTSKTTLPTKPKSVAEYVTWQIQLCGKKQMEIAKEAGFPMPNMITMIKQGKTKIPLEKIGRFAKAIEVDSVHLFKMCLNEYMPETWSEIQKMFNQPVLTQNELDIIEVLREANVENPRVRTDDERQTLLAAFNTLKPDNATN